MATLKTVKTEAVVSDFINKIDDSQKREDAFSISKIMENATGEKGRMWGSAIIGFGDRIIKYADGRELDWFKVGFSPRKQNFAFYIPGAVEKNKALLNNLGKHKTGKGCLYITKLSNINLSVLNEIIIAGCVK
jgi:hypothetical protein